MIRSTQSTVAAFPKRLCISIGGHFGPCYEVTLKKGRLTYTYSSSRDSCYRELQPLPQPEEIQPSAEQWQAFRRTLNRLNVWCWQRNYSDPGVCDGTAWSAKIVYSDRSLVSSGDNCFPGLRSAGNPCSPQIGSSASCNQVQPDNLSSNGNYSHSADRCIPLLD
jgi:hypothetical protein